MYVDGTFDRFSSPAPRLAHSKLAGGVKFGGLGPIDTRKGKSIWIFEIQPTAQRSYYPHRNKHETRTKFWCRS